MPTSYYQSVSYIMDQVMSQSPSSILDLGVGFGKYGTLCREQLDIPFMRYNKSQWQVRIDGIEGWREYRNPIHDYVYNKVYYGKIEEQLPKLGMYDVVLFIDVLEHFTKEDGLKLLQEILSHTNRALIVSTPLNPSAQEDYLGNVLETHRSIWSEQDFQGFEHRSQMIRTVDGGAQVFTLFPPYRPPQIQLSDQERERLARVDALWHAPMLVRSEPLHITYVVPHHGVTGGMKMILEQMRNLRSRGHKITALYRGPEGSPVLPTWTDLSVDQAVLVEPNAPYASRVPESDVVVAGFFSQVEELAQQRVPVLYWEQGHEYLFGDVPRSGQGYAIDAMFHRAMLQPVALAGVSAIVQETLLEKFGREVGLVPNGIDTEKWIPGPLPRHNRVLLVGNPALPFKGFDVALHVLAKVSEIVPGLEISWVSQEQPTVTGFPVPIRFIVNPPQDLLPAIYRDHDCLLFTSWYEAFGMPPLEAMAAGVPVVATNSLGLETYAQPGENSLIADPGDVDSLAFAVSEVLTNKELAEHLRIGGRKTAEAFTWKAATDRLEEALRRTAAMRR